MFRKPFLVASIAATAIVATAAVAFAAPASHARHQAMSSNFAKNADANCAALGKLLAPLGNPKTLPGIAHKLTIAVPAFTMALRAQDELVTFDTPAGKTALASRWMATMTSYLDEMVKLKAAATAGDGSAVSKDNSRLGSSGSDAARLSKRLDLHVCFQS